MPVRNTCSVQIWRSPTSEQEGAVHRQDHRVAEHLDQVLVGEAHVARPEEADLPGAGLLHGYELLRSTHRHVKHTVQGALCTPLRDQAQVLQAVRGVVVHSPHLQSCDCMEDARLCISYGAVHPAHRTLSPRGSPHQWSAPGSAPEPESLPGLLWSGPLPGLGSAEALGVGHRRRAR